MLRKNFARRMRRCARPGDVALMFLLGVGHCAVLADEATPGRAAALLQFLCEKPEQENISATFPEMSVGERSELARGEMVFGWRQDFVFADGARARAERIAPQGQLRRLSVEVSDTLSQPILLLIADAACQLRQARAIRYRGTQAVGLQILDGELNPSEPEIPMNPEIPAGQDPGGVTVAIVDSGVNYLLDDIRERLARDARGEILGFDFWDMDDRPFDAHPSRSVFFPQRHGTRIAGIILREAPNSRLVPYRYPRPDMSRMGTLIARAAGAGARIINMSLGSSDDAEWIDFEIAALNHPELLFIVSAGNDGRDIDREPVYPAALPLDNLIVVTSVAPDGFPAKGSNWGRESVDLLVPGEEIPTLDFSGRVADVSGSSYAVARITALASRLLFQEPDLSAAQLRDRIFAFASPEPGDFVKVGWIVEPSDLARDADADSLVVISREAITIEPLPEAPVFRPTLVMVAKSGWTAQRIEGLMKDAAKIIAQCGISLQAGAFLEIDANTSLRDFSRSNAKWLAGAVASDDPKIFFVRDTLDRPAFDAVTFGTSNSRRAPLLQFSVWMTEMTLDPHIALAHELVHVLLDDGTHVYTPGNLMRSDTSPENIELTAEQCELMHKRSADNGLLH